MDSNLLKEAIADAKAVRQTALANAKAALEEAFGTRLEAMFAPKLDEETADAISAPAAPAAAPAVAPALAQEDVVNETDIEEIIRELESELPQDPAAAAAPAAPMAPDAAAVPPAAPAAVPPAPVPPVDAAAVPPMAPAPAPAPMAPAPAPAVPGAEEEMDEEIDVNELLEALKKEEEEEDDGDDKPDFLKEGVPVKTSGIGSSDNKEPSADAHESSHIESSGQSVDSATVGTPDYEKKSSKDATVGAKRPNQGKNATKTNLSTPGGALKENTGGSTPGYPEGAKKTSSGDDASEAERPNQADHATKDDLSTVPSPLKENEQLKSQLAEAEQAITYLRTQLNEINLLNAKLLYTNRLFKEYTMDNQKKMKIVEMFDRAKNVREVKMTYTVVAESLNFGGEQRKKSKVQNITEGMASKPVAGTAPTKQIIAESAKSEMVSKFQKLAGIKAPVQQPKK